MFETLTQKIVVAWSHWVLVGLIQSAVMLLLVLLIWGIIRKRCSQSVGYVLFLLVMLKLLIPVGIPVPVGSGQWTVISEQWAVDSGQLSVISDQQPVGSEQLAVDSGEMLPEPLFPQETTSLSPLTTDYFPTTDHSPATDYSLLNTDHWPLTTEPSSPTDHWPLFTDHFPHYLFATWLTLVTILLAWFAVMQWRFARAMRDKRPLDVAIFDPDGRFPNGLLPRRVSLFASAKIAVPAVCGFFRPMILFPEEMLARLSAGQLRWVLLHELAHIRRRDLQTAFVQRLAVILHFYNPVVWVAAYFMNQLRESACDDLALAADTSISRRTIGDAFLQIVEHSAVVERPVRGSVGVLDFAGSVRYRLARLLDRKRTLHTKTGVGSMTLILLTAILLVPHWQAMPTQAEPPISENVPTTVAEEMVPQPIASPLIVNPQNDETFVRLLDLYKQQVDLEEENFQVEEKHKQLGVVPERELAARERKVINTKITLAKFIIDNEIHFARDIDTVTQARENLLAYYQRLLELAKQDYEYIEKHVAKGTATQAELRVYRQKVIDAEIDLTKAIASSQIIEQKKLAPPRLIPGTDAHREILINRLRASQEEVEATAESFRIGRTDAEQFRDTRIRHLQIQLELLEHFPDSVIPNYSKRTMIPVADVAASYPEARALKYSPAEQGQLKTLYQQKIDQENLNLELIQAYYESGDSRGNKQNSVKPNTA